MPTPSSNPPPDLPPRTHSSSCPDPEEAARSSSSVSSWRPDQDDLSINDTNTMAMNIDSPTPDASSSPEPVGAPPLPSRMIAVAEEHAIVMTSDSRSATESPEPDADEQSSSSSSSNHEEATRRPVASMHKPPDADDNDADMVHSRSSAADAPVPMSTRAARQSGGYDMMGASMGVDGSEKALEYTTMGGGQGQEEDAYAPSMGYDYSNVRIIPSSPSSYLRPGSKFHGTQQSERQVYDVQVEIKYVDLRESFLCGFLKIQGLTEDNPTLTTYFEGEIIGSKYGFITKHQGWGASDKIDLNHWGKFTAFRQYAKAVRKGPVTIPNLAQRENIFMRWKEHFLVPDHRVRTINGASFEGFYYICFNQKEGSVSGIYFHSKSEKFQQLELKHVEDRGCFGAVEFR
ncbi:vacuolar import and degradation protein-domain-containing protein [Hypomontagnella submonticulosa]|nr:vacuolar import and degradation protein-domain-containing protein [Hypomontagnella submonticulosa]